MWFLLSHRGVIVITHIYNLGGIFILRTFKNTLYAGVLFVKLGRHGNFTAGVTLEQPDLLCTALALNIELLTKSGSLRFSQFSGC